MASPKTIRNHHRDPGSRGPMVEALETRRCLSPVTRIAYFNSDNGSEPQVLFGTTSKFVYGYAEFAGENGTLFYAAKDGSGYFASKMWMDTSYPFPNTDSNPKPSQLIGGSNGDIYGLVPDDGRSSLEDLTGNRSPLYSFDGVGNIWPAKLAFDSAGNLFGISFFGGNLSLNGGKGDGVLFEVPAGTHQLKTVFSFDDSTGQPSELSVDPSNDVLVGTILPTHPVYELPACGSDVMRIGSPGDFAMSDSPVWTMDHAGNLYISTDAGGDLSQNGGVGLGSLFEVAMGSGQITKLLDYNADHPFAMMRPTPDFSGNLYWLYQTNVYELQPGLGAITVWSAAPPGANSDIAFDAAGDLFGTTGRIGTAKSSFDISAVGRTLTNTPAGFVTTLSNVISDEQGNIYYGSGSGHFGSLDRIDTGGGLVITKQPRGAVYVLGGTVTISAAAIGGPDLKVQWQTSTDYQHWSDITDNPTATTTSLVLSNLAASDNNKLIRVVFTDSSGSAVPPPVDIRVEPPVYFDEAANYSSEYAYSGTLVAFASSPIDPATIKYQWSVVSGPAGAEAPTLVPESIAPEWTDVTFKTNGNYTLRCTATDAAGYSATSDVKVHIGPPDPAVTIVNNVSLSNQYGRFIKLGILADSPAGEGHLTYHWSVVTKPTSAALPTFSVNNIHSAKHPVVTFSQAGQYQLNCDVTDGNGNTLTTGIAFSVEQIATTLRLTPHAQHVRLNQRVKYQATIYDQFGRPMRIQRGIRYKILTGPDSARIDSNGIFSALRWGYAAIEADANGLSAVLRAKVGDYRA